MATTGVAADASSRSRRLGRDTMPARSNGGVSFDSRTGNDDAAALAFHVWVEAVDCLGIMSFPGQIQVSAQVALVEKVGLSDTLGRLDAFLSSGRDAKARDYHAEQGSPRRG